VEPAVLGPDIALREQTNKGFLFELAMTTDELANSNLDIGPKRVCAPLPLTCKEG
jgi:hypothetical protein